MKQKNKKSQISTTLLFTIVISVVSILVLLMLVSEDFRSMGKKAYCGSIHKAISWTYSSNQKEGSFCKDNNFIEIDVVAREKDVLDYFYLHDFYKIIEFNNSHRNETIFSPLPNPVIEVIDAEVKFEPIKGYVNCSEICEAAGYNESNCTTQEICLEGGFEPVELVFIIDISGSMGEEWLTINNTLNDIEQGLDDLGVDYNITIYALGFYFREYDNPDRFTILNNTIYNSSLELSNSENWGPGTNWACLGDNPITAFDHIWEKENKIIIPMSDELPYEGGGISYSYTFEDNFTINESIENCNLNNVTVYPIYSNDPFGIPDPVVVNLSKKLANKTGGKAFHYESMNDQDFIDTILGIATDNLDNKAFNSTTVESSCSEENDDFVCCCMNQTKVVDFNLTKFLFDYFTIHNLSVDIGFNKSFYFIDELNFDNSPVELEFKQPVIDFLDNCTTRLCYLPFNFTAESNGFLKVFDLAIKYEKCFSEEDIVAHMMSCYERAKFGDLHEDLDCYEIVIDEECQTYFDETFIRNIMIENDLCKILPNKMEVVSCDDGYYCDMDEDGVLGMADFIRVYQAYNNSLTDFCTVKRADVDKDCLVTMHDVEICYNHVKDSTLPPKIYDPPQRICDQDCGNEDKVIWSIKNNTIKENIFIQYIEELDSIKVS